MPDETKNVAASVRARLMNHAQAKRVPFDLVLNRYFIERLLYRLSASPHANDFVLKGATLLMTWLDEPHRGTRDLDLLGFGDNAPDKLHRFIRIEPTTISRVRNGRMDKWSPLPQLS